MKWKCTTPQLLSIPVTAAVIGFGMTASLLAESSDVSAQKAADQLSVTGGTATGGGFTLREAEAPLRTGKVARPGLQGQVRQPGIAMSDECDDPRKQHNSKDLVNSVRCPTGPNEWARSWDPGEIDGVCSVIFDGFHVNAGSPEVCVRLYLGDVDGPFANLTLLAQECQVISEADDGPFTANFDPPIAIPSDVGLVVAVARDAVPDTFIAGMNELGQTAPTYIRGPACGINNFTDLMNVGGGFPNALILTVHNTEKGEVPLGACCHAKDNGDDPDPKCTVTTIDDCDGIWHQGVLDCAEVTCPTQVECPKEDDPCPPCDGDLDDNGVVDSGDLLELLACWGPVTPGCECADLDGNGVIDSGDLLELLAAWGPCPAPSEQEGTVFNEDEPCGERINDGCSIGDYDAQTPLVCDDIVCGTAWTDVEVEECPDTQGHSAADTCAGRCGEFDPAAACNCDPECWDFNDCCLDICDECFPIEFLTRDTDWYSVTVKEKSAVTWHIHAEFPATAFVGWVSPDCGELIILDEAEAGAKIEFTLEACLQPGIQYFLFIAPTEFEGLPCEGEAEWGNAYTVEVECNDGIDCPKGGCCFDVNCVNDYDPVLCELDGGQYRGDGTVCGGPVAADGDHNLVWCAGACCTKDICVETTADNCINGMLGAYRGGGTTCATVDCRDCTLGGMTWENQDDVCDEKRDIDPFNGGCNFFEQEDPSRDPAFEQVCCGDVVGGQIWSFPSTAAFDPNVDPQAGRDLDWRHLSLKEDSVVLLTVEHGFGAVGLDAVVLIAQAGCPTTIIHSGELASGQALMATLDAGKYYVIVSAPFAPSGGPYLECGPNSWYVLDVECGTVNDQVCAVGCGAAFVSHDGYPAGGTCSCDHLSCEVPSGVVDPGNPNHCCPGTCDFCPEEGFCETLCNYQIDNQLFAGGIGFGAGQEDAIVMWAHRHVAPPGGDVIEEIRTNYSHTHAAGGYPVGWAIFADNGAGGIGPVIAADNSLFSDAGAAGNGDLFNRQVFNTGGVPVSGTFFIAVFSTGSTHPAPWSEDPGAPNADVWIAGITVANNPDWNADTDPLTIDPNTWSFAPSNNFGINAIWATCGKGASGP